MLDVPLSGALIYNDTLQFSYLSLVTATLRFWLRLALVVFNGVVVTLPTEVVVLLKKQFMVTLSLLLILIYLFITASLSYYLVRHKYLTRYSTNTAAAKKDKSGPSYNVSLDYLTGSKKRRGADKLKNYLDEFLSAIKVFGYLERPVFHELTKNMTTQRLAPDEILYLDENLGFSIVVEGTMQVYTRIKDRPAAGVGFENDEEYDADDILVIGNQLYHLLNEVKSGAPLSSLLSTLDLFRSKYSPLASPKFALANSDTLKKDMVFDSVDPRDTRADPLARMSPSIGASTPFSNVESAIGTPMSEANDLLDASSVPDIVARPQPSKDGSPTTATIAIIPSMAFQRVQTKYPKATSHIVTMVLTRLYKVTVNAVHNYLGLTKDIFDSEVALNAIDEECKLPSYLYDSVIESFKDQYKETKPDPEASVNIMSKSTKKPRKLNRESSSRYVVLASRSKASHPGDLLSSVPLSRRADYNSEALNSMSTQEDDMKDFQAINLPPNMNRRISYRHAAISRNQSRKNMQENIRDRLFSDEREETEETSLRIAIVENLFKLLGIEENPTNIHMLAMLSGQFSASSSLVGLSTLMNDNSIPISGEKYIYDALPESTRWSSVPSILGSGLGTRSQKVYNTIHRTLKHAQLRNGADPSPSEQGSPGPRQMSSSAQANFTTVKNSFSKHLEIKYYKGGSTLVSQDSFMTGLYYVIHGSLDVSHSTTLISEDGTPSTSNKKLYTVNPGGLTGYVSTIIGLKSLVSIKSAKETGAIVAFISKEDFTKLMDKFYFLQLPVAARLKNLLPDLIKNIDFALEWCHIPAGGVLASQGDLANGFHIVLSGRFRVVRYNNRKRNTDDAGYDHNLIDESNSTLGDNEVQAYEILGEYGHGQSIGEVEVLTASRRTNSLIAVRDSETARIPRTLFEMLSLQNPAIMVKVSRIVANRVLESNKREKFASAVTTVSSSRAAEINSDYKTITILPCVSGLPVKEFADRLVNAFRAIGRNVIALDQTTILYHLGRNAFDERLAHLKLSGYFASLEEEYETVVYVCDTPLKSNWTSTCISQGDCILLLADAEDEECATNAGDYERLLLKLKTTARTDLCLIHPEKYVIQGSTSIWLKNRIWVQGHHHIQMEIPRDASTKIEKKKPNVLLDLATKIASKANPNIKFQFENVKSKALASLIKLNARVNKFQEAPSLHKNDFMRLARILSNEAVGLVLGGGGSRGISHVGVVTALEKHGIPVDFIGGTSIGSFVGGLYAKDNNIVSIYGMSKKFSKRIGSPWRFIFDLTYPVTAYITGYEFNRGIWKVFGYSEIEDFWIKYFCNSTNITHSTMEIHERGYAWRFIRASMSLAGLLPPIEYKGSMLLDGGYLDNLPVQEMKNKGAKYVIAVDVGSADDRTPMSYGDTLSGFWVLFNRMNPFSKHPNVPNMMEIQLRLAYVASVNALELAKKAPNVIYLRPPIDDYATLDFSKFDEIYNVGLAYADETLSKWEKQGKFPKIAGTDSSRNKGLSDRKRINRRNSI